MELQATPAPYIEASTVDKLLELAGENPRDHPMLRLMSDAELRRQEVATLKVKNVSEKTLRLYSNSIS